MSTSGVLAHAQAILQRHAREVKTSLDALAVLMHAMAMQVGVADESDSMWPTFTSSSDVHILDYGAENAAIHIVLVRLAMHTVVLATRTSTTQAPTVKSECITERHVNERALDSDERAASVYVSEDRADTLLKAWQRDVWAHVAETGGVVPPPPTHARSPPAGGERAAPPADTRRAGDARRLGDADRDPFAANPPFPLGVEPPQHRSGDGMIMGPDHPIFQGARGFVPDRPYGFPPEAVPPGARFDPVAPIAPPGSRGRFGEPDFDEFAPPNNMFL